MRKSNASLVSEALDVAADGILEEVFAALKENGVSMGLALRRSVIDRVAKRIAEMDLTPNGTGREG